MSQSWSKKVEEKRTAFADNKKKGRTAMVAVGGKSQQQQQHSVQFDQMMLPGNTHTHSTSSSSQADLNCSTSSTGSSGCNRFFPHSFPVLFSLLSHFSSLPSLSLCSARSLRRRCRRRVSWSWCSDRVHIQQRQQPPSFCSFSSPFLFFPLSSQESIFIHPAAPFSLRSIHRPDSPTESWITSIVP